MNLPTSNIILAFIFSLLGTLLFRSHLMSSLLCLEGMMLSLYLMTALTALTSQSLIMFVFSIVILVFSACEAAVGLALLTKISSIHNSDRVHNLNILQC